MTALEYLESLILGYGISSIPVQKSELELLKLMMITEKNGTSIFRTEK